jgi:hypothetical protein
LKQVSAPRIACLVPSITELVCELGLTQHLVARTGFCIHPREALADVPKVGGTKDVNLARLRELKPTHVIVNVDENTRETADALKEFVPEIIVTHPQTPEDNLVLYRQIGAAFGKTREAQTLCTRLQVALDAARASARDWPREAVLYLIWKDPWMTVSRATYISAMLAVVGWDTWPAVVGAAKTAGATESTESTEAAEVTQIAEATQATQATQARYPSLDAASQGFSECPTILLSTEPYSFREAHQQALLGQWPGKNVALIDGEMTSWYGPRAIAGLNYLTQFRAQMLDLADAAHFPAAEAA